MTDMTRTDSTQAMKSILSAYGDEEVVEEEEEEEEEEGEVEEAKSEAEAEPVKEDSDDADDHSDKPDYNISNSEDDEPKPAIVVTPIKRVVEDASSQDNTPKKMKTSRAPATKLVSYGGDEIEDDDIDEEDEESDSQKFINHDDSLGQETEETNAPNGVHRPLIELPPEPTERCSNKLQVKILKLYQKMQNGMDLNASIQRRKDFRNPNIYEKLVSYCNIDEKGTNYPPELYDPSIWGKESFYDELAKAQKIEMDKREKERKERTKVEFVTGTKKQTPDGTVIEHKRKSKWDSQPSAAVSKPIIITTNIINPSVVTITTSSTGVKTAIISATGALKKPK